MNGVDIINYLLLVLAAGPNDWNSNKKVEPTITITKIISYLLLVFAAGPTGDPLSVPRRTDLDKQIETLCKIPGGKR